MSIEVSKAERVLTVTLARPEKRNALSFAMCRSILEAFHDAQADKHIGAILIRAEGTTFSAGMDVAELDHVDKKELARLHDRLFTLGRTACKPIVVEVAGAAFGGGLGVVAQGHIVVADPNAQFALTEIRLGMWPFLIYRSVAAAIGERQCLALSLTGETFSAEQAYAIGLVHKLTEDARETARTVVLNLARSSPSAIEAGLQYVREAGGRTWDEKGLLASRLRSDLMAGADLAEGLAAFGERREPRWPSIPAEFYAEPEK